MEQEFTFDNDGHQVKKSGGVLKFLWNSETRELLGRDGASWAKVSLFYAVFYTCLGSFFVGMLAVFMWQMPKDRPTYYGESSTMNARVINPGLGFRPQIDVEDSLIMYNPLISDNPHGGYLKFKKNLEHFLNAKYGPYQDASNVKECANGAGLSDDELKEGKVCNFDYKKAFADSDCTHDKNFGFTTNKACVLIKLNKIISWRPKDANNVTVRCVGETSSDRDNLRGVRYLSGESAEPSDVQGTIDVKYFPFMGQKDYRAPFIFAQFDIPADTLVNVECRAYAPNIDNIDKLNRRGMTKFSLYVSADKP